MATAEQLKALIRNHLNDQSDQFYTTALQVAAHEAKNGHTGLAYEIRSLVDKAKSRPNKIIQFTPDLSDLIISSEPMNRLSYLVLSDGMKKRLNGFCGNTNTKINYRNMGFPIDERSCLPDPQELEKPLQHQFLPVS